MKAYSYNEDGVFVRECNCQPNPVRLGSFLVPGHATTVPPPAFDPETERAVWDGSGWCVEAIPPLPEPGPVPEPQPSEMEILQLAVAELAEAMEAANTENQMAIAELAEALLGGE